MTGAANAAGAAPAGVAPDDTGSGPAAGGQGGNAQGANGTVTMSGADMATLIGQAIAHVLASHPATSGVSPAPRPRAAVPEAFVSLGVSADEYEQLSTCMKAVKMTPPDKGADENGRDVGFFLTELKSFNVLTGLPKVFWGLLARMHLSWRVRKSWDQEIKHLQTQSGNASVDWDDFEVFMRRSFANMLPAREARRRYDKLSQTGSVKDYVRELVQVVRELEGTPYHPGGSVFDDFIKGLKSDVRRFVQDHAPTGWWTDINDLYQKALDYEVNGLASGRVRERSPERTNQPNASRSDAGERRYAGKKRKGAPAGSGGAPPQEGQWCRR